MESVWRGKKEYERTMLYEFKKKKQMLKISQNTKVLFKAMTG